MNDATIQFTEPENAHAGKGFARLVPTATAAAALRQDDILLQPNTSYLLTYYAYPV